MYEQELFVCNNCFEDPGLVEFIKSNASATECSFCPTKADVSIAAPVDDVSTHFIKCLFREYDLAANALGWSGSEVAQFRCGDWDAATKTVHKIRAWDLRHEPKSILKLAQLKLLLGLDGYIEDAYLGRRCGMDDPDIHFGYFCLFLALEKDWCEPESVGPNCSVLLKSEGTERWWLILDNGEESHGSHEISPSQEFAQRLLGRQVGDTIILRHGIEDLAYEVADVQSKFVRAFQETAEEFSTRFPENMNLFRVQVKEDDLSKIFQTVDRRAQFVHRAERVYRGGTLPFATFCINGRNLHHPGVERIY